MKRTAVTLLIGLCLGTPCGAQDMTHSQSFTTPPTNSDGKIYSQSDPEFIPSQPPPAPPNVPPRPALVPAERPASPLLRANAFPGSDASSAAPSPFAIQASPSVPAKPSLAWRAKAHKLKSSGSPPDATLTMSYQSAISTIADTLSRSGLRIQTLNENAGELVAVSTDPQSNVRILFVFNEMPPGTVSVRATTLGSSKTASIALQNVLIGLGAQFPPTAPRMAAPASARGSL